MLTEMPPERLVGADGHAKRANGGIGKDVGEAVRADVDEPLKHSGEAATIEVSGDRQD